MQSPNWNKAGNIIGGDALDFPSARLWLSNHNEFYQLCFKLQNVSGDGSEATFNS
jgi:hypothetical protein